MARAHGESRLALSITAASRIALVGAGFIADVHAEVIVGMTGTSVAAVVDPVLERANALASRLDGARAVPSLGDLGDDVIDIAHVLTPPATHGAVAEPLLRRGVHVLLEKPMATNENECAALERAAAAGRARIAVNHNFIWHPAFVRLLRDVRCGVVGPLRHVDMLFMPLLRQLAAGQLGHWMFRSSLNLLLEQGIHPLSQLDALIGPVTVDVVSTARPRRFCDGRELTTAWRVLGHAGATSFTLTIDLGGSNPHWRVRAVGSDGFLESDLLRNTYQRQRPMRWIEPADHLLTGATTSVALLTQAAGNAFAYGLSQIGLRRRADGFFLSMRESIERSHRALRAETPEQPQDAGRRVVAVVERIAAATAPPRQSPRRATPTRAQPCDVLLVGGTGFIGRHLVSRLIGQGRRVRVVARNVDGLADPFHHPRIEIARAEVTDEAALTSHVERGQIIIHLAHGAGIDWPSVERNMVGGASVVARAARDRDAAHLVFVSSIAALFLGDASAAISDQTPSDPIPEARGAYARGKIECERLLRSMSIDGSLPLTIVRPGLVVGPGTSPFHPGLGEFNRETCCLGWNAGDNPLPFVLVSDVVAALATVIEAPFSRFATYNLVGDARPTARDYVGSLARATGRPLIYIPRRPAAIAAAEAIKWAVKRLSGRRAAAITLRDIRSRGLVGRFETGEVKARLDWRPVADPTEFMREAFADVG